MKCGNLLERIASSGLTLVYGPAAVGKTNLSLYLLSLKCKDSKYSCLYATSEGLISINRLLVYVQDPSRVYVHEILDLLDLVDMIAFIEDRFDNLGMVVVDSINAPYRVDALIEGSAELFGYIVSSLHVLADKGLPVIATAQVHAGDEGVEAVGINVLDLWSHRVIRMEKDDERGVRKVIIERGIDWETGLVLEFKIDNGGLKWLRCYQVRKP